MKLATFFWKPETGWSLDSFPPSNSRQTLVLAFGSSQLLDDPTPMVELREAYPDACLTGCSTAGEIFGSELLDGTLAVVVAQFEGTSLQLASEPLNPADGSFRAGAAVARHLSRADLRGILIFADGLRANGSELLRGLNQVLYQDIPPGGDVSIPVAGGLAADGDRFERTWTAVAGVPKSGWVTAVGFYGDRVRLGFGCQGGWTGFGPQRTVTRSRGNVLYELDGKPALQLYQEYLGKLAWELPTTALLLPLTLGAPHYHHPMVRTAIGVDRGTRSMIFTGDIPEGSVAQLMLGNAERLIDGAIAAALIARHNSRPPAERWDSRTGTSHKIQPDRPTLAIAIGGSGRRLVLGERTEEELEATLDELPDQTQQIGFYGYGEFAPHGGAAVCRLQNQTLTLIAIQEASD
ncbi:MAG: FIST signal transduction protein [Limnospira sp.]